MRYIYQVANLMFDHVVNLIDFQGKVKTFSFCTNMKRDDLIKVQCNNLQRQ